MFFTSASDGDIFIWKYYKDRWIPRIIHSTKHFNQNPLNYNLNVNKNFFSEDNNIPPKQPQSHEILSMAINEFSREIICGDNNGFLIVIDQD
jgi:hypothetical protein